MGPVHLLQFSMHLQIVHQKSDWFLKILIHLYKLQRKPLFIHTYLITSPHWRPGGGLASNIFISDIYYLCMLSESAWWEARVLYWLLSSFSGWKIDCLNQSPLVAGPSPSTKRGILFRTREKPTYLIGCQIFGQRIWQQKSRISKWPIHLAPHVEDLLDLKAEDEHFRIPYKVWP